MGVVKKRVVARLQDAKECVFDIAKRALRSTLQGAQLIFSG